MTEKIKIFPIKVHYSQQMRSRVMDALRNIPNMNKLDPSQENESMHMILDVQIFTNTRKTHDFVNFSAIIYS
jgi:hypothetical protein